MHSITRIIATTDFSAAAELAVQRAALIAKQLNAELHLMHVVRPLDLYANTELSFGYQKYFWHMQQELSKDQLNTLAAKLQKDFDISAQIATRIGGAHTEIASYAASNAGCLIVAGARGESENNILNLLLGSTATRLLRAASCPVLIVKNKKIEPYRQAIAAVDFSSGSSEVPTLACTVAPEAAIETLHIFELIQEASMRKVGIDDARLHQYHNDALIEAGNQLDKILADQNDSRMTRKVVIGYPAAEICARATQLPADLIVIGRHGMSGFHEWLLGSVSKDVSQAAACDVLIVNQRHEAHGQ
jgi:nucleotide-binding universal stress UspA family protein